MNKKESAHPENNKTKGSRVHNTNLIIHSRRHSFWAAGGKVAAGYVFLSPSEEETLSSQMAVVGGANRALYSRYDSREDLTEESPRPVGVEARKVASTAQSDHTHPNAAPAEPSTTFTTTTTTGITTTKPESKSVLEERKCCHGKES